MYEIKKILVPVDFSDCSRAAFSRAMALANQLGARVTVLHVAEVLPATSGLRLAGERGHSTVSEYVVATGRSELEEFLHQLTPASGQKPEVRVDAGAPRERILREAENGAYDLLVMGTHGRTGRAKPEVRVDAGAPRERILREAENGAYDLLVMGTLGRTGLAHALAGSVTESVVRMASCPVLTVRE
jgi:nucleotide-binding universal stress UspA family protein